MAASPSFRFAAQAAGVKYSSAAAATVTASLVSTDGVSSVVWSVAGTDETRSTASYTLTPSGSIGQSVSYTAGAAGTAVLLQCTINGGVDPRTGNTSAAMTAKAKSYVPTANAVEVVAAGEENESSSTHGWAAAINPALRLAGSGTAGVSSVSGTGRISVSVGATPAVSSAALETIGDNALAANAALTDASQTITVSGGKHRTVADSISAARTYTLGTSGATTGDTITVTRPAASRFSSRFTNGGAGGGHFDINTSGTTVFRFDGTNWIPVARPASNGVVHLNVRDFGAIGDGTTNDTAAIQACLAAVPDGGGEVFFPPGQYLINGNLTISRSGTKVYGAGSRVSQIYAPTTFTALPFTAACLYMQSASSDGTDGVEIQNIEIANLGFYGSNDIVEPNVQKGICGIFVFGLLIRDCHFEHFGRETIHMTGGSTKISAKWTIRNNTFKDCGHDGAGGLGAPSCINIGSHDTLVSGNYIENCYGAIGAGHCERVAIVGNIIKDPYLFAISVGDDPAYDTKEITVSGNTITAEVHPTHALNCIYVVPGSKNVSVSGNSVGITFVSGSANMPRGIRVTGGSGIEVTGNTVQIDFAGLNKQANAITAEPATACDVSFIGNSARAINTGGIVAGTSWHGFAGIALTGGVLKTVAVGNRAVGFDSTISGFSFLFSEQGGTHTASLSGNSHDSTGYVGLVGLSAATTLAEHAVSYSTVCSTKLGARARWPSNQQAISAAGNAIVATYAELVLVSNTTGGSITLTSAPTIANGKNGQTITVMNLGSQNIVLQDQGTLASSNLRLTATTITLAPRHSVELTYLSAYDDWFQTGPVVAVL